MLRNNQVETQLLLKDTISTISSSQSLLQTRKVEAVDKLWEAMLALKEHFLPVTVFFSFTLPREYKTAINLPKISVGLKIIDKAYIFNYLQKTTELEKFRPYLGETLWIYFFAYRAILGRLARFIIELREGKELGDWRQDELIQEHLETVFEKEEFNVFINSSPVDLSHTLNILDSKVIKEISFILSGRKSSLESFESSKELRKLLDNEKYEGA